MKRSTLHRRSGALLALALAVPTLSRAAFAQDPGRDVPLARAASERQENAEVREVRRRMKVMRKAVDAFVAADRTDSAERVEQAIHARELMLERRSDADARRIRDAAPDRGELAELMERAAKLYEERGWETATRELRELSGVFAEQQRRRAGAPEAEAPRREVPLGELEQRMKILRLARAAWAEAGRERAADYMERFVHLGELQSEGASAEQLNQAAEGLSIGGAIESLQGASALFRERGQTEEATVTRALAEYYAARERERSGEAGDAPGADERRTGAEEEARRRRAQAEEEAQRRRAQAEEEAQERRAEAQRRRADEEAEARERRAQAEQRRAERGEARRERSGDEDRARSEDVMQEIAERIQILERELEELKALLRELQSDRR